MRTAIKKTNPEAHHFGIEKVDLKSIHHDLELHLFYRYLFKFGIIDEQLKVNEKFKSRGILEEKKVDVNGKTYPGLWSIEITEKGIKYFKNLLRGVDVKRYDEPPF